MLLVFHREQSVQRVRLEYFMSEEKMMIEKKGLKMTAQLIIHTRTCARAHTHKGSYFSSKEKRRR